MVWSPKDFLYTKGPGKVCPLLPLLFILSLQPLAFQINSDSESQGIPIEDSIKLFFYADNILLTLQNPKSSLTHNLEFMNTIRSIVDWTDTASENAYRNYPSSGLQMALNIWVSL